MSQDNDNKKALLELIDRLDEKGLASLRDFAAFLVSRLPERPATPLEPPQPRHRPRPDEESVVGAIKRLSDVYHMIDRSKLLHETSSLMAQHMLQGRAAAEVIDDLEALFDRYYQKQFGGGES